MWGNQRSLKADFEWHILGTSCGGVCVRGGGFLCPEDNYPDGSTERRGQRSQKRLLVREGDCRMSRVMDDTQEDQNASLQGTEMLLRLAESQ